LNFKLKKLLKIGNETLMLNEIREKNDKYDQKIDEKYGFS